MTQFMTAMEIIKFDGCVGKHSWKLCHDDIQEIKYCLYGIEGQEYIEKRKRLIRTSSGETIIKYNENGNKIYESNFYPSFNYRAYYYYNDAGQLMKDIQNYVKE